MSSIVYRNHQHYIAEGWSREPKETFKAAWSIIRREKGDSGLRILDVGCATGEFIGFLASVSNGCEFVGVDVVDALLEEASRLAPFGEFKNASALDLPIAFSGRFDVVTAIGCMSSFDETEIAKFWSSLVAAARPGGLIVVLSPLNRYGADVMTRHRKRVDGRIGAWEGGWNLFSIETIRETVESLGASVEF